VEQFPKLEGRQMVMVIAPKKKPEPVKKEKVEKPAGEPKKKAPPAAKPAAA